MKSGGIFNSKVEPCIVIQHTDHPHDYFQVVISFHEQSKRLVLAEIWNYGYSPLFIKSATGKLNGLGGAIFGTKDKWEEESRYYGTIYNLITKVFELH